jgi:hypothetical protein
MNTETAAAKVSEVLDQTLKSADIVFMFGSVATGYDDETAEKNLVVIGNKIDPELVNNEAGSVADDIKPNLVISTFTKQQFAEEFLSGKIFIRKSANAPKTFLKGDDDDLWHLYYDA